MLYGFLAENRSELVERCRVKVAKRSAPQPTSAELQNGIPLFLEQLIETLRSEQGPDPRRQARALSSAIGTTAKRHGHELLERGFTVEQVVHDYGDLCQAVTELAAEKRAPVTVDEFRTLNLCLDNAIADAVTAFGSRHDQLLTEQGTQAMNVRLGYLAHELRNLVNAAILAFQAVKSGKVALTGATGSVLERSLGGLRLLIDRSLAEVRLTAGLEPRPESISIADFLADIQVSAVMEAQQRQIKLEISPGDKGLAVHADVQMLCSAVANLLQNAFKFTPSGGHVALRAHVEAGRVLIDVADECGGLPPGKAEELFRPFEQRGGDRTGLGLGLSISRRGVEASGGKLSVRNLPGSGCVFTIDLPSPQPAKR